MPSPETIHLGSLVAPILGKSPSGQDIRFDGKSYNEIKEARREDDPALYRDRDQAESKRPLKKADWPGVIKLTTEILEHKSKDLQVAAWLTEALVRRYGFAGLRDGLKVFRGLLESFWDTLYPLPEGGDPGFRQGPLEWLNTQLPLVVKTVGITRQSSASGYSCLQWEGIWKPDAGVPTDMRIAEQEFERAVAVTPLAHCQTLLDDLIQTGAECDSLNAVVEQKFGEKEAPDLTSLKEAIEACKKCLIPIVKQKGGQVPGEAEATGESGQSGATGGAEENTSPAGGIHPSSRADALRRLNGVAEFFRKTEPHSPVSYLVQRAVRWGQMPLENWLKDVINDEAALGRVRETLGLKDSETEQSKTQ